LTVPIRSAHGIEAVRSPRSSEEGYTARMCNLYSMTKAQDAMHHLFRVKHDRAGICRRFGDLPRSDGAVMRVDKGGMGVTDPSRGQ
jgi:hypothetical protein